MNLRTKIILFLSIFTIAFFVIIIAYFTYPMREKFNEQVLNNIRIAAEGTETTYFAFTEGLKDNTISLSSDTYIKKLSEKIVDKKLSTKARTEAIDAFGLYLREQKMPYNKEILVIDLLDENGIVVASSRPKRIGTDERKKEATKRSHYFSKAITAGIGEAFVRSIVFEAGTTNKAMLHITTRMFSPKQDKDGQFVPVPAVLLVHFTSLHKLTELFKGSSSALTIRGFFNSFNTSEVYIVNYDRLIVTPTRSIPQIDGSEKTKISTNTVEECLNNNKEISGEYLDYRGVPVIGASMCLQDDGIVIINEMETSEAYALFNHFAQRTASIGGMLFLLIITALYFAIRRPLSEITATIELAVLQQTLDKVASVSTADIKGNITYVNDKFVEISKYSKEELIGKNHRILKSGFHPPEFYKEMWDTISSGKAWRGDIKNKAKDGTLFWADSSIVPVIDSSGKITHYVSTQFTIYDRKELEEKLKQKTSNLEEAERIAHFGSWVRNTETGEVTWSAELSRIYGYDPMLPALNFSEFTKLFTAESLTKLSIVSRESLQTGEPYEVDLEFVRPDGTRRWVTSRGEVIRDENKKVVGFRGVAIDITKTREIEKMRQDLLSLASHQLRTPLSGIKWLIETLKNGIHGTMNKEQTEYINEIYNINERMTKLVSEMLNAIRMESGMDSFKRQSVWSSHLFDAISMTMTPAAQARQISLRFNKENNVSLTTSPELLRNILESFVSNAITYSPEGKEVFVDVKEEGDTVVFSVKDSGIGIPKDEQGPIFSRFYRASNAKVFNTKSSGLGLYIAATLAEKIGAKVSFETEEGHGSTFFVRVPFAEK